MIGEKELKAKYLINLQPSWLKEPRKYNLSLFCDPLLVIKRKILRFLGLRKENPIDFIFSHKYDDNSFIFNNEDDFYFFISLHLQSQKTDPFLLEITHSKPTKKALLQKEAALDSTNRPSDPIYEGLEEVFCVFCKESSYNTKLNEDLGLIYGPFKEKNKEYYTHERCALWCPAVYLDVDDKFINLIKEINRSYKHQCSLCGGYGATLGCYISHCKNTYHFKCSLDEALDCALDFKNFILFCHEHKNKAPETANTLIYENIFCEGCGKGDDESNMIICEKCLNAFHIYCLEEKLSEIPEEDWYCKKCKSKKLETI